MSNLAKLDKLPEKLLIFSNGNELVIKIMNLEQPLFNKKLATELTPFIYLEEDDSKMNFFTK